MGETIEELKIGQAWSKKMWRNLVTKCEEITGHHNNFVIPENNELEEFEELFEI